ncbi:hypothetical protein D3C81_1879540 [compost metagenome]
MLDLGGSNPEGKSCKSAMGGGVRVAADNAHARQCGSLFRTDDVEDALARVRHGEFGEAEFGAVAVESLYLLACHFVNDALVTMGGWHIVVGSSQH